MTTNGNGNGVFSILGKAAVVGFCGLCILGFFNLSSRVEANLSDHQVMRTEAVDRVADRNMAIATLTKENAVAHSEICQRLARIEALLK